MVDNAWVQPGQVITEAEQQMYNTSRLRVPYFVLDVVRTSYRLFFKWKRVAIAVGVSVLVVLVTTTGYFKWKLQNGWCVRYSPDGVQILYGEDCKW